MKRNRLATAISVALHGYPATMMVYGYDATMREFDTAAG
jgi:hypothetical protein